MNTCQSLAPFLFGFGVGRWEPTMTYWWGVGAGPKASEGRPLCSAGVFRCSGGAQTEALRGPEATGLARPVALAKPTGISFFWEATPAAYCQSERWVRPGMLSARKLVNDTPCRHLKRAGDRRRKVLSVYSRFKFSVLYYVFKCMHYHSSRVFFCF